MKANVIFPILLYKRFDKINCFLAFEPLDQKKMTKVSQKYEDTSKQFFLKFFSDNFDAIANLTVHFLFTKKTMGNW